LEAEYHGTQSAPSIRKVVERLQHGITVGLSIGLTVEPELKRCRSSGQQSAVSRQKCLAVG
jgi:hypothetical protein